MCLRQKKAGVIADPGKILDTLDKEIRKLLPIGIKLYDMGPKIL